jgi:hypothetical protein
MAWSLRGAAGSYSTHGMAFAAEGATALYRRSAMRRRRAI